MLMLADVDGNCVDIDGQCMSYLYSFGAFYFFCSNIQGLYAEGGLQRFVIDEAQLDSTSSEIQVAHRSHYDLGFRHCLSIWGNEFREP